MLFNTYIFIICVVIINPWDNLSGLQYSTVSSASWKNRFTNNWQFERNNTIRLLSFPCKHTLFGFANKLNYVTLVLMGWGRLTRFVQKEDKSTRTESCYSFSSAHTLVGSVEVQFAEDLQGAGFFFFLGECVAKKIWHLAVGPILHIIPFKDHINCVEFLPIKSQPLNLYRHVRKKKIIKKRRTTL